MYNMLDIRKALDTPVAVKDVQKTSGLMRKTAEDIIQRSQDPRDAILSRIRKYQETANLPLEEESTTGALGQAMRPVSRAEGLGVDTLAGGDDWVATTAGVLRELEGFKEKPYYDMTAYRAGYGSDTYTTADGEVVPVTKNSKVSREDAERDLDRRIRNEFGARARDTAGEAWATYTPLQKAALTSVAYNYGSIPDRISEAVRSGNPEVVARAIMTLAGDNDGINKKRRIKESEMMLYGRQ
jgi:GH24 family phage-related lysozyme (muramidase)